MKISIIALGDKMPSWVNQAYQDYAKRLPKHLNLELIEIPVPKRQKSSAILALKKQEAQLIEQNLHPSTYLIALDEKGKSWTSESLAQELASWLQNGRDLAFIIGGPDGIDAEFLASCSQIRSLSAMTLPHPLVRILLIEQLYRAHSILHAHPYHRA